MTNNSHFNSTVNKIANSNILEMPLQAGDYLRKEDIFPEIGGFGDDLGELYLNGQFMYLS